MKPPLCLLVGLLSLALLPLALAFVADTWGARFWVTEGVLALLALTTWLVHLRAALSPLRRRALLAFALAAVWCFGALTFQGFLQEEPAPKWWELTRVTCLRGEPESLLDLFLIGLCPLGFFIDLVVGFVHVLRWLAELAVPVLWLAAAGALATGVYSLVRARRAA